MPSLQKLFSKYNIDTSASAPNSLRGDDTTFVLPHWCASLTHSNYPSDFWL